MRYRFHHPNPRAAYGFGGGTIVRVGDVIDVDDREAVRVRRQFGDGALIPVEDDAPSEESAPPAEPEPED